MTVISGVEITKYFSLSFGKVSKTFTCPALFLPVLDMQTDSNFLNFSLSSRKVSKIFTCPAQFLPVPNRRTACNFHPCNIVVNHFLILCRMANLHHTLVPRPVRVPQSMYIYITIDLVSLAFPVSHAKQQQWEPKKKLTFFFRNWNIWSIFCVVIDSF